MDFGVGSLELGNNCNFEDEYCFECYIQWIMEDDGVDFGLGGYGEVCFFYIIDIYQVEGNSGLCWCIVYLGLDVWVAVGMFVFVFFDGWVYSFVDNVVECDYGFVIILEYILWEGLIFYIFYGYFCWEFLI